jgi:hypothetical protein
MLCISIEFMSSNISIVLQLATYSLSRATDYLLPIESH